MAESSMVLKFTWENGVEFKMTENSNAGGEVIVIRTIENGDLNILWPHIDALLRAHTLALIEEIGTAMKA